VATFLCITWSQALLCITCTQALALYPCQFCVCLNCAGAAPLNPLQQLSSNDQRCLFVLHPTSAPNLVVTHAQVLLRCTPPLPQISFSPMHRCCITYWRVPSNLSYKPWTPLCVHGTPRQVRVHRHARAHTHTHKYTHTHIHAHTHAHTHTHKYTHTQ